MKGKFTSQRLTGLFDSKREGMYVGNIKPEDIEKLKDVLRRPETKEHGLVTYLFDNGKGESPRFSLSVDSAKPYDAGKQKRRQVIDDDDEPAPKKAKAANPDDF